MKNYRCRAEFMMADLEAKKVNAPIDYPRSIKCFEYIDRPGFKGYGAGEPPCDLVDDDGLEDAMREDLLTFLCCAAVYRPECLGNDVWFSMMFYSYDRVSIIDQKVEVFFHFEGQTENGFKTSFAPSMLFDSEEQKLNETSDDLVRLVMDRIKEAKPDLNELWNFHVSVVGNANHS